MGDDAARTVDGPECARLRRLLHAVSVASDVYRQVPIPGTKITARTCDLDEARDAVMEAFDDETLLALLDEIGRLRTPIEPDNHHNALVCPYCNPDGHDTTADALKGKVARQEMEIKRLRGPHYVCSHDGYHPGNRATWCALGCGSDYNRMHKVEL